MKDNKINELSEDFWTNLLNKNEIDDNTPKKDNEKESVESMDSDIVTEYEENRVDLEKYTEVDIKLTEKDVEGNTVEETIEEIETVEYPSKVLSSNMITEIEKKPNHLLKYIITIILCLVVGIAVGFGVHYVLQQQKIVEAEEVILKSQQETKKVLEDYKEIKEKVTKEHNEVTQEKETKEKELEQTEKDVSKLKEETKALEKELKELEK